MILPLVAAIWIVDPTLRPAASTTRLFVKGSVTARDKFSFATAVIELVTVALRFAVALTVAFAIAAATISASGVTNFCTVNSPSSTLPFITSSTTTSVTVISRPLPNVLGLFVLTVINASSPSSPPSFWWSTFSVAQK